MEHVILYHRADMDGLMSEAVIRQDLIRCPLNSVRSIGWDFGDPIPELSSFDRLWMVDLALAGLLERDEIRAKTTLIDHHKTAIERWRGQDGFGSPPILIEGTGACRLCWFYKDTADVLATEAMVRQYLTRPALDEPFALFLVGLRDVWAHKGTQWEREAIRFELAMRGRWPLKPLDAADLLHAPYSHIQRLIGEGKAIEGYAASMALEAAERGAHLLKWHDLTFLCLNTQQRGTLALDDFSRALHLCQRYYNTRIVHDALMVWGVDSSGSEINVSLYHAEHRKDLDLSVFAKAEGGGGHPGACGFRMSLSAWQPFLLANSKPLPKP